MMIDNYLSIYLNIIATLIVGYVIKVIPVDFLFIIFILTFLSQLILIKIGRIRIWHRIITIFINVLIFLSVLSIALKTNVLPYTNAANEYRTFIKWFLTDQIDPGKARIESATYNINSGEIELTIANVDEINCNHIYMNIGCLEFGGKYSNFISFDSKEFYDFKQKPTTKFVVDKKIYSLCNDNFYIYIANKPLKEKWIKISNFNHPFLREFKTNKDRR